MNSSNLELFFQAYINKDDALFQELAYEIIKDEESKNHNLVATKLKQILSQDFIINGRSNSTKRNLPPIPIDIEKGFPLLEVKKYHYTWNDLIVKKNIKMILNEIRDEIAQEKLLASYNLKPKNKILLCGPSGTGKTLTAKILSAEIGYPLIIVKFETVISSYLGQTSTNIKRIFDYIENGKWVVLFDEFDIIGKKRDDPTEHGEIKRLVNNFMLMLDDYNGKSLLIASTNHPHILDDGLWRRFDEIISYELPDCECREQILTRVFSTLWKDSSLDICGFGKEMEGFSGSDIEQVALRAIKKAILNKRKKISLDDFISSLNRQKLTISSRKGIIYGETSSTPLL